MTDTAPKSKVKMRRRWQLVLGVVTLLVLVLVVPPFVSISHYKSQITQLVSRSLNRPVKLSSVKARLLPWPGFVLYDLSVAEDPAYGSEPVLYASKVITSIRLLSLWRGHLEIGKISVDEASLNVVRSTPGHWNLDPLFRSAAASQTGSAQGAVPKLPYMVATNSRINFKDGSEKLPFSLLNTDFSLWQQNSGEWRIRLRGQPARTDVSLFQEETGVVRLEGSIHRAATLHQMPIQLDVDWREAQLGQLSRLITGSDPGWRGDLTGNFHFEGTAESAQLRLRLRAVGVHRAEFVPAEPLDFDANCALVYHYARRSMENLSCDSPLGGGHIHFAGDKLGANAAPHLTADLSRIPVAAGLDLLRTLRSGIDPGLVAKGAISGELVYDDAAARAEAENLAKPGKKTAKSAAAPPNPLTGELTVTDFSLSGGPLSQPIQVAKIVFAPSAVQPEAPRALAGELSIPAGGTAPLAVAVSLSRAGYQVALHGQASFARTREFAHAAGVSQAAVLDAFAGDPLTLDLVAAGPWLPPAEILPPSAPVPAQTSAPAVAARALQNGVVASPPAADALTGTVTLRNANWKSSHLASTVAIEQGTLHLEPDSLHWDSVAFSYGPLKGSAGLVLPLNCPADQHESQACAPQFQLHFASLDLAALQTSLLGAQKKGTLLSSLIDRFHPASSPLWPRLDGRVSADSLEMGPVTLRGFSAAVRVTPTGAEISSLDAGLLGGAVHLSGTLDRPATDRDLPTYVFQGQFQKLSPTALGQLLGLRWSGSPLNGYGKIALAGYSGHDLATSAKGALHIESGRGAISAAKTSRLPAALAHFNRFSADAAIADGNLQLGQNQIGSGLHKQSIAAAVTLTNPPKLSFPEPKETHTASH